MPYRRKLLATVCDGEGQRQLGRTNIQMSTFSQGREYKNAAQTSVVVSVPNLAVCKSVLGVQGNFNVELTWDRGANFSGACIDDATGNVLYAVKLVSESGKQKLVPVEPRKSAEMVVPVPAVK